MNETSETNISKLLKMYPNRIPIILIPSVSFNNKFKLKKYKYLVLSDTNLSYFLYQLRKINNVELKSESLYVYINNILLNPNESFASIKTRFAPYEQTLTLLVDTSSSFG